MIKEWMEWGTSHVLIRLLICLDSPKVTHVYDFLGSLSMEPVDF